MGFQNLCLGPHFSSIRHNKKNVVVIYKKAKKKKKKMGLFLLPNQISITKVAKKFYLVVLFPNMGFLCQATFSSGDE